MGSVTLSDRGMADILRATKRMTVDEVRAYRETLVPARIRDEVAEQAETLAGLLRVEVAA